jgi:peptidyl-prolyl cis-trans isomerase B (cyclophilin B)
MLQASIRTMGLVLVAGVMSAALAWADEPAKATQTAGQTTTSAAQTEKSGAAMTENSKAATPAAHKAKSGSEEVAVMETTKGRMVIEFWDKDAPQTVENFKKLARQGFFDGTGFHRIIKGFMIQGGDPKSKNPKAPDLGTGDPGYKIKDEFNSHKHVPGVLSMANSGTPNSAGSQFFIVHGVASSLDGKYTAFGHLIEGMNVLNEIANTPVGPNAMMGGEQSKPLEWTSIKSVKIVSRSTLAKGPASGGSMKASSTKKASTEAKAEAPASGSAPPAASTTGGDKQTAPSDQANQTAPSSAAPADSVQSPQPH